MRRSRDWFRQAERDIRHAKNALKDEDYEWACFAAQQAAEKAVKALAQFRGGDAWGHSILIILKGLSKEYNIEEDLLESAANLDKLYIPTRYPNGFDAGIPGEYYNRNDADEAIKRSEEILKYVRREIS